MALKREAILKHAGNVETRVVQVKKWADETGDCDVILRAMTIKEFEIHQARVEREAAQSDGEPKGEAAARLLARVIIDETGARVFTDDDVSQISNLGLAEIMKLDRALNELSGLGADAEKQDEIDKAIAGESAAQSSST